MEEAGIRMFDWNDPLDENFPLGDGTAESVAWVYCPYCGEENEIYVDPGGGPRQDYVEDCPVCCRPWQVTVRFGSSGELTVELTAEDGT